MPRGKETCDQDTVVCREIPACIWLVVSAIIRLVGRKLDTVNLKASCDIVGNCGESGVLIDGENIFKKIKGAKEGCVCVCVCVCVCL